MGLEALCTARFGNRRCRGKALLETSEVVFRGEFRVAIPFREIRSAVARNGDLILEYAGGRVALALGEAAGKWADKILNPKSLLDKLGLKAGMNVTVVGVQEPEFLEQLRNRVGQAFAETKADVLFLGVSAPSDLGQLETLQQRIKEDGAVWIVRPKGNGAVPQMDVLRAGRAAGLVDVKVVSFSPTHTAEKFVVPLSRRKSAKRAQRRTLARVLRSRAVK
jgi:hypothetical protein